MDDSDSDSGLDVLLRKIRAAGILGTKTSLTKSLDKLFELTEAGYTDAADPKEFLKDVTMEVVNIRQALMGYDKPDRIKCAEAIGYKSQFFNVLVPFMEQLYKGKREKGKTGEQKGAKREGKISMHGGSQTKCG
jgi:hypothetical protein